MVIVLEASEQDNRKVNIVHLRYVVYNKTTKNKFIDEDIRSKVPQSSARFGPCMIAPR